MKVLAAVLGIVFLASIGCAKDKTELTTEKDKVSYSIGTDIGNSLKRQEIDIDTAVLFQGIRDVMSGGKLLLTDEEMQSTMEGFRNQMMAKQQTKMKELGDRNKQEGDAFLEQNKKDKDVITLPSGLQYKVITEGDGAMPKATDKVTVHYKGTLIDGTEFDSSYSRGEPATFPVNGVIPGWTEALQLMKAGSKWQLFVPSNLAYGERGAGGKIGPNAALIFDVELISVN